MTQTDKQLSPFEELTKNNPALARELKETWEQVLFFLRTRITDVAINTWLKEIYPVAIDSKTVTFYVANKFQLEVITSRYATQIKEGFTNVLGSEREISFIEDRTEIFDVTRRETNSFVSPASSAHSDYEYTFDTFIVGNSNRFANAASIAVSQNPANSYNPLFIYGGSGLGKTHLLYAIMNEVKAKFPGFKVVYLKGDDFTNELIRAIQQGSHVNFRSKYRYADLLLVDDIQFIAGKEMTQEEFFHTFNTLYEAKKQIVLTSDRPPKEISTLEERLRTRFEWGLLADVQPPDFETRVAIIKRKANTLGVTLPDDVIDIIANNVKTNIRQLEGAVKKLKAFQQLTGAEINASVAQSAIKDMFTESSARAVTPEYIITEVAKFYNMSSLDLIGKRRTNDISLPRQVAMYIIREMTDLSLPGIGQVFGGRDHTTVIHAIRRIEEGMDKNIRLKQTVFDLVKNIKEV